MKSNCLYRLKKNPITLIELLLVLTILVTAAGLMAIPLRRAIVEQHFKAEVAGVMSSLRLAQDLMLLLNSDVHLHFSPEPEKGIRYWLETEKSLSAGWEKELKTKVSYLKTVHVVEMQDQLAANPGANQLDIKFLSGGYVMSRGVLTLATADRNLMSSICLSGYPRPIKSIAGELKTASCVGKEAEIAELLTRDMMHEIQPRYVKKRE